MPDHALTSARCYLDWLMPPIVRQAEPEAEPAAAGGPAALGWRFGVTPATPDSRRPPPPPRRPMRRRMSAENCCV